jgi:hypothetical protein
MKESGINPKISIKEQNVFEKFQCICPEFSSQLFLISKKSHYFCVVF